jgi:hypothetical protein
MLFAPVEFELEGEGEVVVLTESFWLAGEEPVVVANFPQA